MARGLGDSGFTLIEFVTTVSLSAFVVSLLMSQVGSLLRDWRFSSQTTEILQLRAFLSTRLDCLATFTFDPAGPAPCSQPFMEGRAGDGSLLIKMPDASGFQKFDSLWVRLRCVDYAPITNSKKLLVEFTRDFSGADGWKDLHEGIPFPCTVPQEAI